MLRAAREVVPDLGETAMGSLVRALAPVPEDKEPAGVVAIGDGETLTDAELRVLALLPGDLTYREMAQHLFVSLNTVRTDALRIRRKPPPPRAPKPCRRPGCAESCSPEDQPAAASRYCWGLTPRTRLKAALSANGLP
jgi:hypothetical protein